MTGARVSTAVRWVSPVSRIGVKPAEVIARDPAGGIVSDGFQPCVYPGRWIVIVEIGHGILCWGCHSDVHKAVIYAPSHVKHNDSLRFKSLPFATAIKTLHNRVYFGGTKSCT